MSKGTPSAEPHRSFTVRIPESLYADITELAMADKVFVNNKVNQLLRLGLGQHIDLSEALSRLLKDRMTNG